METNKLDDNFKKLKQSMLEKKLKAEANKAICKDSGTIIDVNNDVSENTNKIVNENVHINDDINVCKNVHKDTNISDYNDVNITVNNNINKFVLKPKECEESPVRYTMYLKPDTINKIGHYSKLLNLGKSELAQKILEYFLNNIEIID